MGESILQMLIKGDARIRFSSTGDAVLVLGGTGTGKTTLTHFLALNNDNLMSVANRTGSYTIQDHTNKFCYSTEDLCTVIPELVVDHKANNAAYYDCSLFSDMSETQKTAAIYFMHEVLRRTDSVKLVFTISYDAVRKGKDPRKFMELAKNVFEAFADITEFGKSICLIVTRVDNLMGEGDDNRKTENDVTIIKDIMEFLSSVKENLEENQKTDTTPENNKFYRNTIELINILITEKQGTAPRIGIFPRPRRAGPLSEISAFQETKSSLQRMISHLDFSISNKIKFSQAIFNDSATLHQLRDELTIITPQYLASIDQQIEDYYHDKERQSDDIIALAAEVKEGFSKLSNLTTFIGGNGIRGFIEQVIDDISELEINISTESVEQILNLRKYLEFIESMTKRIVTHSQPNKSLEVVRYLNESNEWYRFLIDLQGTLSTYEIQKNVQRYTKVTNDLAFDLAGYDQKNILNSLNKFLTQINHDLAKSYVIPRVKKLDSVKLKFLKDLMEVAFSLITHSESKNGKLVVKGNNIKITEIAKLPYANQAKTLDIYSLNKVFIDGGFILKEGLMRVFTPQLEVVNEEKLIFDGRDATGIIPPKAVTTTIVRGHVGTTGKPGLPGGSAGGFVGIGQTCPNCNTLSISAIGGKGGRGQDGGDGVDGVPGRTPGQIQHTCDVNKWQDQWRKEGLNPYCTEQGISGPYVPTMWYCTVGGSAGGPGGDGGAGGRGGMGGNAGEVFFILTGENNASSPLINTAEGSKGMGGLGGRGGNPGRTGDTLFQMSINDQCVGKGYYNVPSLDEQPGKPGPNNINNNGVIHPVTVDFNPSHSINKYKDYLRRNTNNSMTSSVLKDFLEHLEINNKVNSFYDTGALVDDLLVMAQHSSQQQQTEIRSYHNFLNRIIKYAQNPRENERSSEYKLVLSYLYASIMSKICRIKENTNNELVIDIKGYLQWVTGDIKQLENLENAMERSASKSRYQNEITGKIKEGNSLIKDEILPDIDKNIQKLKENMQALLDEVITLERNAQAEEDKFVAQRNKLQEKLDRQMSLGFLFGTFKFVSQALGFFGPLSAAVGSGIGLVSTVAQELAVNQASAGDVISHFPSQVNVFLGHLKDHFKERQEFYKSQLSKAEQTLKDFQGNSTKILEIQTMIKKTQTVLDETVDNAASGDRLSMERIFSSKKQLNSSLKDCKKSLESQKETTDSQKIDKQIYVVSKVQCMLNVADTGLDIFSNIDQAPPVRDLRSAINALTKAIEKDEQAIARLKDYEEKIYNVIFPISDEIKDVIDAAVNSSAGKSHAALDVSKWKVQDTLREIQNQLKDMTDGFKSQISISNTVDKVMFGMNTVIQVYDRIQDYYDQARLADYISDVTSNSAKLITVTDSQLQNNIDILRLEMQKNIVLSEYEKSMCAVRQYVFPYGAFYMAEFYMPNEQNIAKMSRAIPEVINNIVTVLGKLEEQVTVIRSSDEHLFPMQIFNSYDNQHPPFYVWKHNFNKGTLAKLLQGEAVLMNADIVRGVQENAIKFHQIGIYFKVACKQLQEELNEALDGFSVRLTHLGNSNYRCGNRIFLMTHSPLVIEHSASKRNGEYFSPNEVYEKIVNNDPLVSPYGMWKMQLTGGDFSLLTRYIGHNVDIELEGQGSYIDHEIDRTVCNDDLKQYYQEVENKLSKSDFESTEVNVGDPEECEYEEKPSVPPQSTMQSIQQMITNSIKQMCQYLSQYPNITNMFQISSNVGRSPEISNSENRNFLDVANSISPAQHNFSQLTDSKNASMSPRFNYDSTNLNSNLLLMDLIIRKVNGNNRTRKIRRNPLNIESSQKLVYRAYAHN